MITKETMSAKLEEMEVEVSRGDGRVNLELGVIRKLQGWLNDQNDVLVVMREKLAKMKQRFLDDPESYEHHLEVIKELEIWLDTLNFIVDMNEQGKKCKGAFDSYNPYAD